MSITEKREKKFFEQYHICNFSEQRCFFTTSIKNDKIYVHVVTSEKERPDSEASTLFFTSYSMEERPKYLDLRSEIIAFCKKLRSENIQISEKDFINHFKSFASEDMWINPIIDFENNKQQNAYSNNYANNQGVKRNSDDYKIRQIKPYVLLETLKQNGIIQGHTEPNTRSEVFWQYKLTNSFLPKPIEFKTSVKKLEEIRQNPSDVIMNVFKDVRTSSKGYPVGSLGLVMFLGDHGLFSEKLTSKEQKIERAKKFLISIYNSINKINLFDHNYASAQSQDYKFPFIEVHRLPFKIEEEKANIIEYLTVDRKLSRDTVNTILNDELVYNGEFYMNSFDNKKPSPIKQFFFEMKDKNGVVKCTERYDVKKQPKEVNGIRTYENKADKKFTHLSEGTCFKITNPNAKLTYFSEGVPDALSLRDFNIHSNKNPNDYNYWSIPGVTSLHNILAKHMNIGYELTDDVKIKKFGKVFFVEEVETTTPLTKEEIEKTNKSLKEFNFVFVNTNSELCKKIMDAITVFKPIVDIKVINQNYRSDPLDYDEFGSNTLYLDETNFIDFFKKNNLTISNVDNQKVICSISKKDRFEPLNENNIEIVKNNIERNFKGTSNFACAFDQDNAGRDMIVAVNALNDHLNKFGINFYDALPSAHLNKKDWNELLKEYVAIKDTDTVRANEILSDFNSKFDFSEKKIQNKSTIKPT